MLQSSELDIYRHKNGKVGFCTERGKLVKTEIIFFFFFFFFLGGGGGGGGGAGLDTFKQMLDFYGVNILLNFSLLLNLNLSVLGFK